MSRRTERIGGGKTTSRPSTSGFGSPRPQTGLSRSGSRTLRSQRSLPSSSRGGFGASLGRTERREILGKTFKNAAPGTGYGKDMLSGYGESTEMSKIYSDNTYLPPRWNKVSETPWTPGARVYGGYGRHVGDHTVSHDAPAFFHIPAVQDHEGSNALGFFSKDAKRAHTHTVRHDTAVSGDAPTWFHIDQVERYNPDKVFETAPKFEKMLLGRTVIFEPESMKSFQSRTRRGNNNNDFYN